MSGPGTLERIMLSGFKSIKHMDLKMRNLNILIGPNGSGKSNFIGFFNFMNKLVEKELQLHVISKGGADQFLHFGRKKTSQINIQLFFKSRPNSSSYQATLIATQDDNLIFTEEAETKYPENISTAYQTIHKESMLFISKPPLGIIQYLLDWKVYHFHDTSDTAKMKRFCNIHDNDRLAPQGDNLSAFLFSIQDKPEYSKIVETIQRVAPFFQNFILRPEKNNPDIIRLKWKHKGSDAYFDANSLSDGTLRFICLTTLLLQPNLPPMILLDEPELGLHPYALQLLGGMLRSVSTKTQIIASTQSVTLANQFDWEDLIIVEQIDNASQFKRLQEQDVKTWLDDYKMGEIWEKNLIGGTL